MEQIFTVIAFLSLFSFSQAQCTGTLTNSTLYVSVSWTTTSSNTVSFSFTAPANTSLYTALAVSENIIVTPFQFNNVDAVYAGDNGTTNFVQDRWISNFMSQLDVQQDIEDTSTELSNGLLTVNFTRPIVSTDNDQDIDLDACRYLVWTYGGIVDSFVSPNFTIANLPKAFGTFDGQICLQSCAVSPSPISTYTYAPESTGTTLPSTIATMLPSTTPSSPSAAVNSAVASIILVAVMAILLLQYT